MPEIEIITGDATNLFFIKKNSIDLVIAAPPFINRHPGVYGGDPKKQINFDSKKMLNLLIKSTKEMERVLKPTGSIWIEISPEDGLMYKYVAKVLEKTNLKHTDTIIHKVLDDEGMSKGDESIYDNWFLWFHFVKSPEQAYSNPFKVKKFKDPVWEFNLSNKDDTIDKTLKLSYPEIVDYTVVKEIPERFIEMYTKPNALILDPFGGSGMVASIAYGLDRNSISVDISPKQAEIAKKRIDLMKVINYNV